MSDEDCEIEYLDEDEEIVQQCVQVAETTPIASEEVFIPNTNPADEDLEEKIMPLFIERKPVERPKRKIKVEEEDSDYDPSEDLRLLRDQDLDPPRKRPKRSSKKPTKTAQAVQMNVSKTKQLNRVIEILTQTTDPVQTPSTRKIKKEPEESLDQRRILDIQIPDYEDPLCLPVRAFKKDERDWKNLRHWNNTCLEAFKKADTVLKADSGRTKGSIRSVVLRNVMNKVLGKIETTVWGKVHVESEHRIHKSEVYQCVLPRYREKNVLKAYDLFSPATKTNVRHTYEVLLTKEEQKDGEVLVAYKPHEGVSAVYRAEQNRRDSDGEEKSRITMKEVTCCKVCTQCYHTSWRGVRRTDKKDNIPCKICSHTFVSVYNLLAHLKTHHTNSQVNKYRIQISRDLANVVGYHYKCRLCQQQLPSIKQLRKHITKHKSIHPFECEIGNHVAS